MLKIIFSVFLFLNQNRKKLRNMKYAPKCEEKWCRNCKQQCRVRNLPTSGKIAHILYNEPIL